MHPHPPPSDEPVSDDLPDELDFPDDPETLLDEDGIDAALLDPAAWPDDEEDDATARLLAEPAATPDPLGDLPWVDDEPEGDLPSLDDDLLDTQHDLDLRVDPADDESLAVLPLHLTVEVDGVPVPARVNLGLAATQLVETGPVPAPTRSVTLRIRDHTLHTTLAVTAGPERVIVLARDVLHGRFLLRP